MMILEAAYKYVKLHCNGHLEKYIYPPEIDIVRKYFAKTSPKNVLELGCGLGRVSIGFYRAFRNWQQTNFWLLDGNSGNIQVADVDSPDGSFYNSLDQTAKYCLANEMLAKQIYILNAEKQDVFDRVKDAAIKFDFVYSFLAIGFHWPMDWYLSRIDPFIRSGTILIFGIRPDDKPRFRRFNTRQICAMPDCFSVLKIVTEKETENFIVLRRK